MFNVHTSAHCACPLVGVLLCEQLSFKLRYTAFESRYIDFELRYTAFEFRATLWRNAENSGQLGNSMGGDEEARKEQKYTFAKMCSYQMCLQVKSVAK